MMAPFHDVVLFFERISAIRHRGKHWREKNKADPHGARQSYKSVGSKCCSWGISGCRHWSWYCYWITIRSNISEKRSIKYDISSPFIFDSLEQRVNKASGPKLKFICVAVAPSAINCRCLRRLECVGRRMHCLLRVHVIMWFVSTPHVDSFTERKFKARFG